MHTHGQQLSRGLACAGHARAEPVNVRQQLGTSSTRGLLSRRATGGGSEDRLSGAHSGPASISAHPTGTLVVNSATEPKPIDGLGTTRCRHQAVGNARIGSKTCRMRRSRVVSQRTTRCAPEGERRVVDPPMDSRRRPGSLPKETAVETGLDRLFREEETELTG